MENAFTPRLTSNDEQERRINGPPGLIFHHVLHNNDNSVCQSLSGTLYMPLFVDNPWYDGPFSSHHNHHLVEWREAWRKWKSKQQLMNINRLFCFSPIPTPPPNDSGQIAGVRDRRNDDGRSSVQEQKFNWNV